MEIPIKDIRGYIPLFASFISQIMLIIMASEAKRVDWVNNVYTRLKRESDLFFDATKKRPEPKVINYTQYIIFIILDFMAISAYFYLKSIPENRCYIKCCVMMCSEKTLNPGQT